MRRFAPFLVLLSLLAGFVDVYRADASDLTELSLEDLMQVEVTTVSKKPEIRSAAPAAASVITSEDLHRSGLTSIAEALRLAPGAHVARVDANQWSVSIRGFSGQFSNKLLVLMDGRTLYTPLFAGVFWDAQDTLLEDVERIEIVRGPGGTLWGANAVNGVINVITRDARDTQGWLVSGGGGSEERGFGAVRYGGKSARGIYYRVYGKAFDRDDGFDSSGSDGADWRMGQGGFRADWHPGGDDHVTLQGDLYGGSSGQLSGGGGPADSNDDLFGANLLGRVTRTLSGGSSVALQSYFDTTDRDDPFFHERRHTFDVDFQHRFQLTEHQELVWGSEYRLTADDFRGSRFVDLEPDRRAVQVASGFVQDELSLLDGRLRLTAGSKFEHNDFTGFEVQPSGRLAWVPSPRHTFWASVSHAVRIPSRIENDILIDVVDPRTATTLRFEGNRGVLAEKLIAYETGYRLQPFQWLYLDAAAFLNQYDRLVTSSLGPPRETERGVVVVQQVGNRMDGEIHGFELAADAEILPRWRLRGAYSWLEVDLNPAPGSVDPQTAAGSSPRHQASLRSLIDLSDRFRFDVFLRYVDSLPAQGVGAYVALDLRLAADLRDGLEVALVGQNLIDAHHREFSGGTELQRGAYAKVTWRLP